MKSSQAVGACFTSVDNSEITLVLLDTIILVWTRNATGSRTGSEGVSSPDEYTLSHGRASLFTSYHKANETGLDDLLGVRCYKPAVMVILTHTLVVCVSKRLWLMGKPTESNEEVVYQWTNTMMHGHLRKAM